MFITASKIILLINKQIQFSHSDIQQMPWNAHFSADSGICDQGQCKAYQVED